MERENIGRIMPRFLKTVNCNDSKLQQYMDCELPDVQAGFRKGRGTKDQIVNICWIIKKARVFQKKYLLLLC